MAISDYREIVKPPISEDDLVDALIESKEALHEIDLGFEEIEHLEGVGNGLESLDTIVASIESATIKDLAFIDTTASIALTGTGLTVESVFPSLESARGKSVGRDSLKQIIKKFWEAIVATTTKLWAQFKSFMKRIWDSAERLQVTNQHLKSRITASAGKTIATPNLPLTGGDLEKLSIGGKVPRNGGDLEKGLAEILAQAEVVYDGYSKTLAEAGLSLAIAIERFDPSSPEKSLERIIDAGDRIDFSSIERQMGKLDKVTDKRWSGNIVKVAKPLPSNRSLFFISPDLKGVNDSILGRAEASRNRRIRLTQTSNSKRTPPSSGSIGTLPIDNMTRIAQHCGEILRKVIDYRKNEVQIIRAHQRLKRACAKMKDQMMKDKDLSSTATTYFRAAVSYELAMSSWAMYPHTTFTDLSMDTVRTTMKLCNASLKNYE